MLGNLPFTHCGRVTQYGDGSRLCFYTTCCRRHIASLGHNGLKEGFPALRHPFIFHNERIPSNLSCCDFVKVNIIIFQNPLQKLRICTFLLFLLGTLTKQNHFFKGCGEKMAITRLILRLKLPAYHREPNFGYNQAMTRH